MSATEWLLLSVGLLLALTLAELMAVRKDVRLKLDVLIEELRKRR